MIHWHIVGVSVYAAGRGVLFAARKMRPKLWRLLDSSAPNCCPVV
jgi:hypothetical protein